jgi:thiamine biosynthesis lipoprotein
VTRLPRAAALAAALLGVPALGACARPPPAAASLVSDGRYAMGTVLEITLAAPRDERAARQLDALYAAVEALEAKVSNWRPASDTSRLAAAAGGGLIDVDPVTASLLARCVAYTGLTRGAFDVTVGPLVTLWRDAGKRGAPPSDDEIARARERVGSEMLRVDEAASRAALERPGMTIDVGGVAKGLALDVAAGALAPGTPALLSFGQSSLRAVGAPPGATGWRVLLRLPEPAPGTPSPAGFAGVLTLRDRSLSVSGSLGQWTEIAGRRYGHVIDPRSGRPLERRLEAAVVAPDATLAEALSKALLILGPDEGIALLESQPGVEGWLADDAGHAWATRGWADAVAFEPLGRAPAIPDGREPPAR